MSRINLYNVYDFVTYEPNLELNLLWVKWDKNNEDVDKIMMTECYQSFDETRGFMWIEEVKRLTNWVKGDIINIIDSFTTGGKICIRWEFNRIRSARYFVILEDGYLYKRSFRQIDQPLVKIDCFYNELWDDEQLQYIFK
jgi:hypothetical protein